VRAALEGLQVRSDLPPDVPDDPGGAVGRATPFEMAPDMLIWVQVRSVRREVLQPKAVRVRCDEGTGLPGTVVRTAVHDEHELASAMMREQFAQEPNEDVGIDFHRTGHEQQFSARSHRGQQAHDGSARGAMDLGRVATQGPSAAGDMVRAHAAFVTEVENRLGFSGLGANPWVLRAQPSANRPLIPFQRALEGTLRAQPFASQEFPQAGAREGHVKLPTEQDPQTRHRPQVRQEPKLRGRTLDVLLELANLRRSQSRPGSGGPSAAQRTQPSVTRAAEPLVDDLATEAHSAGNDLGRLTLADFPHRLETYVLQYIPSQPASVSFDHIFTIAHIRSCVN
jgi:hypothetical protein